MLVAFSIVFPREVQRLSILYFSMFRNTLNFFPGQVLGPRQAPSTPHRVLPGPRGRAPVQDRPITIGLAGGGLVLTMTKGSTKKTVFF